MELEYDYGYLQLEGHVLYLNKHMNQIKLTCYSNYAPKLGDRILKGDKVYVCTSVNDDTSDEEREQGLTYSKVELEHFN